MKQLLINLSSLLKRGYLRIFPKPVIYVLLALTLLTVYGCASSRHVTQLVRDVHTDTLYLSNVQYDSIYIYQDKLVDRSRDTLYIKEKSIEYRYKLLRDTIYKTQVDSIPYQVTVTEVKEITRPLTWYDHLTRSAFWIVMGVLFVLLVRFVFNLKNRYTL